MNNPQAGASRIAHTYEQLARKYACQGPRYTSYPTAPQFHEEFSLAQFLERQQARGTQNTAPLSLYVHIPFCEDICYYCACNKIVTRDHSKARGYLDSLIKEIELQSALYGGDRPVTQLHWGGGTPTFLDDAEITQLMHALASHFKLLDRGYREYSIEIDPRTVSPETIALLKGIGFNRISLGIQDFDPLVQKTVNRIQSYQRVKTLVERIRAHGFRSLSFDLIYGLPYQDGYTMENTLDKVLSLQPDRIACYSYAHLPERFSSQRAIDRENLPSPAAKIARQEQISKFLRNHGYLHIGLDHYVRPDDDLAIAQREGRLQRNFQGYSVQMADELLGLGVSAISQMDCSYVQNERDLECYTRRLAEGEIPIARGFEMSEEDLLRRHIIMSLVCNLELDTADCGHRFGVDFNDHFATELNGLKMMQRDGLLHLSGDQLTITEQGRPFLRNICMLFDQYLPLASSEHAPGYSVTV